MKVTHNYQQQTIPKAQIPTTECSFSTLKLIKTKLRNRTGNERLSDLAVINIHKAVAENLDINSIIDEFAKSKRKIDFTNESL